MASQVEHPLDFVFFFPFDKLRGRFMEVDSMFWRLSIRCEQQHVEDVMQGLVRGELEAIYNGRDLLEYLEWSVPLWS